HQCCKGASSEGDDRFLRHSLQRGLLQDTVKPAFLVAKPAYHAGSTGGRIGRSLSIHVPTLSHRIGNSSGGRPEDPEELCHAVAAGRKRKTRSSLHLGAIRQRFLNDIPACYGYDPVPGALLARPRRSPGSG